MMIYIHSWIQVKILELFIYLLLVVDFKDLEKAKVFYFGYKGLWPIGLPALL